MKEHSSSNSAFIAERKALLFVLCVPGISLAMLAFAGTNISAPVRPNAPTPASGTLSPGNPTITYTDGPLVTNETGLLGPPDCTVPNSCSDFTLTVNASSVAATKEILIQGTWTPTQDDFDMFIEN